MLLPEAKRAAAAIQAAMQEQTGEGWLFPAYSDEFASYDDYLRAFFHGAVWCGSSEDPRLRWPDDPNAPAWLKAHRGRVRSVDISSDTIA